jgi:hypothetical protein
VNQSLIGSVVPVVTKVDYSRYPTSFAGEARLGVGERRTFATTEPEIKAGASNSTTPRFILACLCLRLSGPD